VKSRSDINSGGFTAELVRSDLFGHYSYDRVVEGEQIADRQVRAGLWKCVSRS
jgi:hypothetical protein